MSSEVPVLLLLASYILTTTFIAPRFMKNRESFNLTNIIRFYNLMQVASCAYIVFKFHKDGWTITKALSCESELPKENYTKLLETWWICIFIRAAEFLETIFFILRKKSSQVTFLHVYHHVSSFFIVWVPLKYGGSKINEYEGIFTSTPHIMLRTP